MGWRDRLRWIFLLLIGLALLFGGTTDTANLVGGLLVFASILGAWWHSELLRRKREAKEEA